MFYRTEGGITKKASRETGALTAFYKQLFRRAHLLTTDKVGGVTAYGRRALYEVLFRYFAPKRQICFGGSTPLFSSCDEKQQIFHSYNRYTRKEVIAYRHIPS